MLKRFFEFFLGLILLFAVFTTWYKINSEAKISHKTAKTHKTAQITHSSLQTEKDPPTPELNLTLAESNPKKLQLSPGEAAQLQEITLRFRTGDYHTALELADEAQKRQLSPDFKDWISNQMPAILISAGWLSLKQGDCSTAVELFLRAEKWQPRKEIFKGLSFCYIKNKDFLLAESYLQQSLAQGNDPDTLKLYVDLLESTERYDEAKEKLETLLEIVSTSEDEEQKKAVRNQLHAMTAKQQEGALQQSMSSIYFKLTFRSEDHASLAPQILGVLDQSLGEFLDQYGFQEPKGPIEVLLYPDAQFRDISLGEPAWAGGLFDGRMRIPISPHTLQNPQLLEEVLRHELVHALMAEKSDHRQLPPWFEEGLAQRASCIAGRCATFVFPPNPGHLFEAQDFNTHFGSYDALKAQRIYKQSFYLILLLERWRGLEGVKLLVERVNTTSDLSSDGLLSAHGISLRKLLEFANASWQRRLLPQQISSFYQLEP